MSSVGPPPLPAIQSERIEEQIFIHPSLVWGHRDDFQAPESHPSPDNEELAHIGDQALSLVVTDLIQVLYPTLRVGPSSKVRDLVKHRPTLAEVSVLYGLHERLRLPERQARRLRASQNVQAHVFKVPVFFYNRRYPPLKMCIGLCGWAVQRSGFGGRSRMAHPSLQVPLGNCV